MRFPLVTAMFVAVLASAAVADARPGSLDTSFGDHGVATTEVSGGPYYTILGLAVQSDGKIIAASPYGLVRYLADGSLDTSYGSNGFVPIPDGAPFIAPTGGDRLLVATVYAGSVAVERRLPDGSLDPSFGTDGIASVGLLDGLRVLALQSDKILLAWGNIIVRLAADGSIDTTFGDGGASNEAPFGMEALAVQADGAIVIGSTVIVPPSTKPDFTLSRLDANGHLDPSFGTNGVTVTDVLGNSRDDLFKLVARGNDVIAVGRAIDSEYWIVGLLYEDGVVNPAFRAQANFLSQGAGNNENPPAAAVDADGNLVVVVSVRTTGFLGGNPFGLMRFEPNGTADATFGAGGSVLTYFSADTLSQSIALAPDGALLVGGAFYSNSTTSSRLALARYVGGGTSLPRCPHVRSFGCTELPTGGKSLLTLKNDRRKDGADGLAWQWSGTASADLGDPLATDDYTLCLYQESNEVWPPLRYGTGVSAGGSCGDRPCWKASGGGFKYASKTGAPLGVTNLSLRRSGVKTSIAVKGRGAELGGMNCLPLTRPLVVQLHASGGQCWSTTFTEAGRNEIGAVKLSARR